MRDVKEKRELFIKFLEEIIQDYIKLSEDALANYKDYLPLVDYTKKKLFLRKPKTDHSESVGSSSNHMFMQLFFSLGLHEAIIRKQSPFIPSFLIIDQPSRPYYGDDTKKKTTLSNSDEYKINIAFKLLDEFMERVVVTLQSNFQIIVLEHVPPKIWEGMKYVHLVDTFDKDNALIPKEYL